MTTKETLRNDLAAALAINQHLRSTAVAAALFPLIEAFALESETGGHGIRAVNALPAMPSESVPDIVLLAQADGDNPVGLYFRLTESGAWLDLIGAERQARQAGDDLQIESVGTAQRYIDVVALQAASDSPLRMIITADMQVPTARQGVTQDVSEGEILEFAPRSNTPEPYRTVNINWRADQTHVSDTAETEIEWNAKTLAHANVHNNLWLRVTKRLFSTIGVDRRAREIGELYHIPPRSTHARFIVDTTSKEEAEAIINTAIQNGVQFWARAAPGNVVDGKQVYPTAGAFAPGYDNEEVLGTDGAGRLSWVAKGGSGPTTDPDRLIATGPSLANLFVDKTTAGLKNWRINFVNPAAIPSAGYWYNTDVQGQPSTQGRRAWAGASAIDWTISDTNAEALSQVPGDSLEVNLYIYTEAAGRVSDFVARRRFTAFSRSAAQGGATAEQAAAIAANTAGRVANTPAIAQNAAAIAALMMVANDNKDAIAALQAAPPGIVLVQDDDTKPVAPVPNHLLFRTSDLRILTYRPKTLVPRATAFGIADFRWTDGAARVWRGLISNYLTLAAAADGDVVFQTTAAGRTAGFFTRQGGGWSPVAANHAPADWKFYADLAAATADTNAPGRVVLIASGNTAFVVDSVLPEAWVLYEADFPALQEYADQAAAEAATVGANVIQWWPA